MSINLWPLMKVAAAAWWRDRAMSLGAAIAFFTVFSLAPILLAAIAVAGLAFGREAAQGALVGELSGLIGEQGGVGIEIMIASASNVGSGIVGTTIGIATFLFVATGAIVELQDDLNIIWKAPPPESYGVMDFIGTRLISLSLVTGMGFLLLVSLVIDSGLSALGSYLEAAFSGAAVILWLLNNVVAFCIATLLFGMIFKILPSVDLTWRDVASGAAITALLFTFGKFAIGTYLAMSNIASSYGAAASIITILLWIYYSSLILLFGAEFTKAYAETRGSRMKAPIDEEVERGGAPLKGMQPSESLRLDSARRSREDCRHASGYAKTPSGGVAPMADGTATFLSRLQARRRKSV